jgi:fibronectin type 3 domain-containing protein/endonuclease I
MVFQNCFARRISGLCLAFLLTESLGAEPPQGYYGPASGLSGAALRGSLHQIIDDHQRFAYTSTATDTWDIVELADEDPDNIDKVRTVYKNTTVPDDDHSQTSGWNREHSWPKSYGFSDDGSCNYPFTDCHALFAADWGYNSARGNRPFDSCSDSCAEYPVDEFASSSNWGIGSGSSGSWEVRFAMRGDIARAMFYMGIRYEGGVHGSSGCSEPDLILTDDRDLIKADSSSNFSPAYMGVLTALLEWHLEDPVDATESLRNDIIFSFQGNRNPFVDHPEWVCEIWTCPDGSSGPPAAPTNLSGTPQICSVTLDWSDSTEPDLAGYRVYRSEVAGGPYTVINDTPLSASEYADTSLAAGTFHYYVVSAIDTAGNDSGHSGEIGVGSLNSGPCGTGTEIGRPWINEIHYDNVGRDSQEGFEICGAADTSLVGWQVVAYNGNGGGVYRTIHLSGTLAEQEGGLGTLWFTVSRLQNGTADGLALVDDTGTVLEFLSYEGTLTARAGPAAGRTSEDIGVNEPRSTPVGSSLQLQGTGSRREDFTWQEAGPHTRGLPNTNQTLRVVGDTSPPSRPAGLVIQSDSALITLNWTDNSESDLAGYFVYRATVSGGPYVARSATAIVSSAYSDTSVSNGTTYFYVVTSLDRAGNESPESDEVSATPADTTPPASPVDLVAVSSDGKITLDWADNTEVDLDGYDVYRALSSGGPYSPLSSTQTSAAVDESVTNGTTYFYVVTARDDSSNESASSNEASGTPLDTTPPAAPLALSATPGSGQVSLAWTENGEPDLDFYIVYRATATGGVYASLGTSTENEFVDNSAEDFSTHYYVVSAVDGAGNESDPSNEVSATLHPPVVGEAWINEIHYDNSGLDTDEGIEIAGTAGLELGGWTVLAYNGNGGAVYETLALSGNIPDQGSGLGTLWFSLQSIQNGSPDGLALMDPFAVVIEFLSYEGTLTATDGEAASRTSTDIGVLEPSTAPPGSSLQRGGSGTTATDFSWEPSQPHTRGAPNRNQVLGAPDTTAPSPPLGLTELAADGSTIELQWLESDASDLGGYHVYRGAALDGPHGRLTEALVTTNTFSDSGLEESTTYHYVVTATDVSGNESNFSAAATATTSDMTAPSAPTGLVAAANSGRIDLDWSDNLQPDLAGYAVYRATVAGGPHDRLANALLTVSEYSDTDVTEGTTYYYVVTAWDDANNESPPGTEASAQPITEIEPSLKLEANTVLAGGTAITVNLVKTYKSAVVVCTVNYSQNTVPIVPRVSNVTESSFNVRLQSPGDGDTVVPETVHYIVIEEGAWTLPGGQLVEAVRTTSSRTDEYSSWIAEPQTYMQPYSNPVVLGQVMSEEDPEWSIFWCHGGRRSTAPNDTGLWIGKNVAEDPRVARADETLGVVIFESGNGVLGGVAYEAALGSDSIRGVGNSPPYTAQFSQGFSANPAVGIVTQAGMDGSNGGWAYLFGPSPLTAGGLQLAIDEDQVADAERKHTTEQVGYIVFESTLAYGD